MQLARSLAVMMTGALVLGGCQGEPEEDGSAPVAAATDAAAADSTSEQAAPSASGADASGASTEKSATIPQAESAVTEVPAVPPVAFAQCRSCHSIEPGKSGIGPSLHGVFGQQAAYMEGFNYSPALKASGITWTREELDEWLAAPTSKVPGTRMVLGVRDAARRKEVIDYLETLE